MIDDEDMFSRAVVATPDEVVDTLRRWADLAAIAGVKLENHVGVVMVEESGLDLTLASRRFFHAALVAEAEELSDGDHDLLKNLEQPGEPDQLMVLVGRGDGYHLTTLDELHQGQHMQRQAAQAGLS